MAANTPSRAVWKYKLAEQFVAVREVLSQPEFAGRLDRPLRDWTVLNDRPIPVCFFDKSIRTLIESSFTAMFETSGVGQKKMAVLLRILRRVAGLTDSRADDLAMPQLEQSSSKQTHSDPHAEIAAQYHRVRKTLIESRREDILTRPVRFWLTPGDRRLPSTLLDYRVGELIEIPFAELCKAPYVGPKKTAALLNVLERAACAARLFHDPLHGRSGSDSRCLLHAAAEDNWDLYHLTEATWREWCAATDMHALAEEPLGRFVYSLSDLARILWEVPLSRFTSLTLAELKLLDGRNPHRVHQVLGVFRSLHEFLAALGAQPRHLDVRIVPRSAARLSAWAKTACDGRQALTIADLERGLVEPLIAQLQIDLGVRARQLSEWRHCVFGTIEALDTLAPPIDGSSLSKNHFFLTEVRAATALRWPDGVSWMLLLRECAEQAPASISAVRVIDAIIELFFVAPPNGFAYGQDGCSSPSDAQSRRGIAVGHRGPTRSMANDRALTVRWPESRLAEGTRVGLHRE